MHSFWENDVWYAPADVLIVGGGLMGMWTAHALLQQKPGLRVTLVEQLPIPALASTRNAGFACFGSPSELWADLQMMPEADVWAIAEQRYMGIQYIRQICGDAAIQYEPSGGYEVFAQQPEWQGAVLQDKLDLLNEGFRHITGLDHTYLVCTDDINRQGFTHLDAMVGNPIEGGLHSGKLVQYLSNSLTAMGATFLYGHQVLDTTATAHGFTVSVSHTQGQYQEIQASTVLWATNAHLSQLPPFAGIIEPARGQVLLSPPIPALSLCGTFHAEEGYFYFRSVGQRLLMGGGRHHAFAQENTLEATPTADLREVLEAYIQKHIPEAAAYLHQPGWQHWAGIMGMSRQKKPIITQLQPGMWASLACNGMGVALTPMAGRQVAAELMDYLGSQLY